VTELVDHPRVAPDGERVAFLWHDGVGSWHLGLRDLATGAQRLLPGSFPVLAWPTWDPAGTAVLAVAGRADRIGVARWRVDGGAAGFQEVPGIPIAAAWGDGGGVEVVSLLPDGSRRLALAEPAFAESAPPRPPASATTRPASDAAFDPRPYGRGPSQVSSAYSGMYAPSGRVYTGGYRFGDLLGAWELFAVAALSQSGEESGGLLSGAWRKWRFPVETHFYRIERRPSEQPEPVPGLGRGLDATEMGMALGTTWRRHGPRLGLGGSLVFRGGQRQRPDADSLETYSLLFEGGGEWGNRPSSRLAYGGGLDVRAAVGTLEDDGWHAGGLQLEGHVVVDDSWQVGLVWRRDRVWDAPSDLERFAVGGTPSSLLPQRIDFARVYEPALPVGALLGDEYERQRLGVRFLGLPLEAAFSRHRVSATDGPWSDWLRVASVELTLDRSIRPLYRLPASAIRVGAAYVFDSPFEGDKPVWAAIAWSL
jgi:hypothetical protein